MKIQAAVLHKPNSKFEIETLDLDEPKSGEVLVKIAATGVCHSDWHLVTGATPHPMPVAVGHEGAGVIQAVGMNVAGVNVGDHVALNWAPNCGTCFYCKSGRPGLCAAYVEPIWAGTMLDGTTRLSMNGKPVYHFCGLACFAEYVVVPQVSCVPIDKAVPFEIASLIGCAVTTGVGSVLNTAQVQKGSSVAVFGAGGVGLSTILGARFAGASKIIAVDKSEAKRKIAMECGATHFLVNDKSTVKRIQALTERRGADYVFEAIGIPAVQEQCLGAVRPGGMLILSGISPVGSGTNLPGAVLTRMEKTVKGSYYGTSNTAHDFPRYADLYLKKELDLDKLISAKYKLGEINEAYSAMLSGDVARGVVTF